MPPQSPLLQDRTGQDRTGQDRTGQDRTGQDRTGQDRTGQDRTGQDRGCEISAFHKRPDIGGLLAEAERLMAEYRRNYAVCGRDFERELASARAELGKGRAVACSTEAGFFSLWNKNLWLHEPYNKSFFQYILDLNDFFRQRNIDFVLFMPPGNLDLAADQLFPSSRTLPFVDVPRMQFIIDLLKKDVCVIDGLQFARAQRRPDVMICNYNGDDGHLTMNAGEYLCAKYLLDTLEIKSADVPRVSKAEFNIKSKYIYLYKGPVKLAAYNCPEVKSGNSPVIWLGDSFARRSKYTVSYLLSAPVRAIHQDAGAMHMLEYLHKKPDSFFTGAKLAVMTFFPAYLRSMGKTEMLIKLPEKLRSGEWKKRDIPLKSWKNTGKKRFCADIELPADVPLSKLLLYVNIDGNTAAWSLSCGTAKLFEFAQNASPGRIYNDVLIPLEACRTENNTLSLEISGIGKVQDIRKFSLIQTEK